MKNLINSNIDILELDLSILKKLKDKNIIFIDELWNLKRADLKDYGLNNDEINQIIIRLQLKGLDLNKRKYIE